MEKSKTKIRLSPGMYEKASLPPSTWSAIAGRPATCSKLCYYVFHKQKSIYSRIFYIYLCHFLVLLMFTDFIRKLYIVYFFVPSDVLKLASIFSDRPFRCMGCGKKYKHKKHLTSHQNYECGKNPQFECLVCGRKFHQKYNLNLHNRNWNYNCKRKVKADCQQE